MQVRLVLHVPCGWRFDAHVWLLRWLSPRELHQRARALYAVFMIAGVGWGWAGGGREGRVWGGLAAVVVVVRAFCVPRVCESEERFV